MAGSGVSQAEPRSRGISQPVYDASRGYQTPGPVKMLPVEVRHLPDADLPYF